MKRLMKENRWIAVFALSFCLMTAMSSNVFADYTYDLDIPSPYLNSMQSTSVQTKETASTPYVKPSKQTMATKYFLSPTRQSSVDATNTITKSNTAKSNFTWKSGYGGTGTRYCLSAYPNTISDYDSYNVSGTWSN